MFSIFCIGRIDRQTPGNAICQDAPCTNSCHLSHLVCSLLYRLYDFQRMDTQADRYDRHSSVLATAEPYTGNVAAENAASFSFLIYVMHFYPMKLFKQGIAHIFYGNDIIATITYILLPIMISYLIILIGQGWIKLSPKTYSLAIGNRI